MWVGNNAAEGWESRSLLSLQGVLHSMLGSFQFQSSGRLLAEGLFKIKNLGFPCFFAFTLSYLFIHHMKSSQDHIFSDASEGPNSDSSDDDSSPPPTPLMEAPSNHKEVPNNAPKRETVVEGRERIMLPESFLKEIGNGLFLNLTIFIIFFKMFSPCVTVMLLLLNL